MAAKAQFEALIMQAGPIPPAGGPAREQYLLANGVVELRTATNEYAAALALLAPWSEGMPTIFSPLETQDDEGRRRISESSRKAWQDYCKKIPEQTRQLIEPNIRRSEKAAVNALNYLEDTDKAEEAHEAIHRAAFVRSGLFGCPITYQDEQFWSDCSINMSHLRIGMSVGITSDFFCSICDEKAEDCDHVMGETYPVVAKTDERGLCMICSLPNCLHDEGASYPVTAQGIGREILAHEVSMVSRPRYPLARITKMTWEVPERYRKHGIAGVLSCDACLGPCDGFNDSATWELT